MGANEYIVLFVAVVYFLGGYVLGRFQARDARPRNAVDPDPLRHSGEAGSAEVIPFPRVHPAAPGAETRRARTPSSHAWILDNTGSPGPLGRSSRLDRRNAARRPPQS
jgi:hypothetical protein